MLDWLKSMFKAPQPAGPPQKLRAFGATDRPITQDEVSVDQNGWRIESREKRTVRLFEVPNPGVEQCVLTYRAWMKTANMQGGVYLEMWCRFPGRGEFFSQGQRLDLLKLNLVFEGAGTAWVRDVEVLQTPLSA